MPNQTNDAYTYPPARVVRTSYESPKLVKSQTAAWTATAQSAAVVTTLFAGTGTQILSTVRSDSAFDNKTGPAMNLLLFASYATVLFNLTSTVASLFFIDRLGDLDFNHASDGLDHPPEDYVPKTRTSSSLELLRRFGGRRSLTLIFWQWVVYLFLGTLFLILQAIMYMWLREGSRVISTVITLLAVPAVVVLALTSLFG
ncbi:hypothetical protein C8R46DRAFT_1095831 [Mycena filopes]|nr:hypothetical protein C8R46DRAFT_1095831 [Mycena filopes]